MKHNRIIIVVFFVIGLGMLAIAARKKLWRVNEIKRVLPAPKEEYTKLMQFFAGKDSSLYYQGQIFLYEGEHPGVVKEVTPFSVHQDKQSFRMAMGPILTISNGTYLIQVDSLNKTIVISPVSDSSLLSINKMLLPFDQLMNDTSVFKVNVTVSEAGNERMLTMEDDKLPQVKESRIRYNPQTYQVNSCEVEWWKNSPFAQTVDDRKAIWVTKTMYQYMAPQPLRADSLMAQIVNITGNTVRPAEAYKNYHLDIEN